MLQASFAACNSITNPVVEKKCCNVLGGRCRCMKQCDPVSLMMLWLHYNSFVSGPDLMIELSVPAVGLSVATMCWIIRMGRRCLILESCSVCVTSITSVSIFPSLPSYIRISVRSLCFSHVFKSMQPVCIQIMQLWFHCGSANAPAESLRLVHVMLCYVMLWGLFPSVASVICLTPWILVIGFLWSGNLLSYSLVLITREL